MAIEEYQLWKAARIFFDVTSERTCNIFDARTQPICQHWESLSRPQQEQAVQGLKVRVEREGLRGYLERKRSQVGNEITDEIYRRLKAQGMQP